jgi:hypothetical protein
MATRGWPSSGEGADVAGHIGREVHHKAVIANLPGHRVLSVGENLAGSCIS